MADARIPIRFGSLDTRRPHEAVLTDGAAVADPHARIERTRALHVPGCACCSLRSQAATALASLFRRRALDTAPAFQGVLAVVTPAGEADVRAALSGDSFASGRYRLAAGDA